MAVERCWFWCFYMVLYGFYMGFTDVLYGFVWVLSCFSGWVL